MWQHCLESARIYKVKVTPPCFNHHYFNPLFWTLNVIHPARRALISDSSVNIFIMAVYEKNLFSRVLNRNFDWTFKKNLIDNHCKIIYGSARTDCSSCRVLLDRSPTVRHCTDNSDWLHENQRLVFTLIFGDATQTNSSVKKAFSWRPTAHLPIDVWVTSLLTHRDLLDIGVFPKWNRNSPNSVNSGKLIIHWSINWAQFKDPVSHMCLAGALVACWFVTQEVGGSNTHFFAKIFFKFCRFCRFYRIHLGKTLMTCSNLFIWDLHCKQSDRDDWKH